jgi:hypothetical protein
MLSVPRSIDITSKGIGTLDSLCCRMIDTCSIFGECSQARCFISVLQVYFTHLKVRNVITVHSTNLLDLVQPLIKNALYFGIL